MKSYSYSLWFFRHLIKPVGIGFLFWKAVSIPIWDFSESSLCFIVCAIVLIFGILFFVYTDKSAITWDKQGQALHLRDEVIPLKKIKKIIVESMSKQSALDLVPTAHNHRSGRFYNPMYLQLEDDSVRASTFDMDFTTEIAPIIPVHYDDEDMVGIWKFNKILGGIGGLVFFVLGFVKIVRMFQ